MSKTELSSRAIAWGAELAMDAYVDSLPRPDAFSWEYSPEFEGKMRRLTARTRRRELALRYARGAAAVFLAVIITLGAFLGVDTEAQAAFFGWARETYESSIVYRYTGKYDVDTVLPQVELTWVPEGYDILDQQRDETWGTYVYQNAHNDCFVFAYGIVSDNSFLELLPGGEFTCEAVTIGSMTGDLYLSVDGTDTNTLILTDNESQLYYLLDSTLERSVILRIAEGAKLSN